eukprot:TRINITY_DN748_c0_g1_i1.p1 TRINITY_DN748_c0_g1~~TRINITY_DN748_c0_g1_i1.p1  ORF type:complete len:279 (+),score=31.78 TRINITY_DN748_c0_g1_i1:262-1098(+)
MKNAVLYEIGLTRPWVKKMIESLPFAYRCVNYRFRFVHPTKEQLERNRIAKELAQETKENASGCARSEPFIKRSKQFNFHLYHSISSKDNETEQPSSHVLASISSSSSSNSNTDIDYRSMDLKSIPVTIQYRAMKQKKKPLRVQPSSIHGWGVVCLEPIKEGELIVEYMGELIRPPVADVREVRYRKKGIDCYMFRLDDNLILDATFKGNIARFINHSCDPNSFTRLITCADGNKKIVVCAKKDIAALEELLYDYKFPIEDEKIPCHCKAPNCRGTMN